MSGTAQTGQTLTVSNGSWSETPTAYAYAWRRCDATGAACAAIGGATGQRYVVGVGDVGSTLRATVTASNSAGASAPASSAPTAVVTQPAQTVGKTTVGASTDRFAPDRKRVNRYSAGPSGGTLTGMRIYLAPTGVSGQQVLRGVVYADAGGAPAARRTVTNELTFHSTDAAGWYGLTLPGPVTIPGGRRVDRRDQGAEQQRGGLPLGSCRRKPRLQRELLRRRRERSFRSARRERQRADVAVRHLQAGVGVPEGARERAVAARA